MKSLHFSFFAVVGSLLLSACAGPSIRVSTAEPIEVDIKMRVDVYQHGSAEVKKTPGSVAANAPQSTPESRRRNRIADIQNFKNSRLVGEGHNGLLSVISTPPGEYGQYVLKTVEEENADRTEVMKAVAERTRRPLPEIQAEQAAEWRTRSFKDEYIEVSNAEGTGFRWEQKKGQ